MTVMTPEPMPENEGEPEGQEASYAGAYDDETGEYQVSLSIPGLRLFLFVHPDAFDSIEPMLAYMPSAAVEIIEAVAEAMDDGVEVEVVETQIPSDDEGTIEPTGGKHRA